jgi:hypothetical protein
MPGLDRELFRKYWVSAHRGITDKWDQETEAAVIWLLLRGDVQVVVTDITNDVAEDAPHLKDWIERLGCIRFVQIWFGSEVWESHAFERSHFEAEHPEMIDADGRFLFAEMMEGALSEGQDVNDLPDITRSTYDAMIDAMNFTVQRLRISIMLEHGEQVGYVDGTGERSFKRMLGSKVIDAEVEKFRSEIDKLFGIGGGDTS